MTTAAGTLELWDALAVAPQAARGAVVLVARGIADDLASACDRPLAEASAAALDELRERAGSTLDTVLTCPRCGTLMEVPLDLDLFAVEPLATEPVILADGVTVSAPTSTDLLAALETGDPAAMLRERCVLWPEAADEGFRAGLRGEVDAAVERTAGAAGAMIRARCPECDAPVRADVDVVRLLSDRLREEAHGLLAEVAALARAYGWAESHILDMPEARRRTYLALARGGS